uniref:Uncharacterized protein n=1 Tax=Romanomermis culicivorax TaxID=13658 RepID=A0A915L2T6_ROMCU
MDFFTEKVRKMVQKEAGGTALANDLSKFNDVIVLFIRKATCKAKSPADFMSGLALKSTLINELLSAIDSAIAIAPLRKFYQKKIKH